MIISDLIIFICILLSAFFSGMEIAFISSNKIFIEVEKKQSGINAKFLNFITKNPSRFIATMLLGNNISLVIYGLFMGDRIVEAFKAIVLGVAGFIDTFRPAINFVFGSFNTLSRFVNSVPPVIASIGILGFLALGTKGRLVVIAIAGVYNKIQDIFREMMEFVKSSTDVIASAVKKLGFDETANQITKFGEAIENMTPKVVDNIEDMKE